MATKCIQVRGDDGVGKRTLIGRLIFSCGEVGLPQMEQLERNGIREYAQIASFYENQPKMRVFYTPSSQFVFDESKKPDTLIWITDATASDGGQASSQKLAALIQAQTPESLVILVNKMDLVNWSSSTFGEIARNFSAVGPIARRLRLCLREATDEFTGMKEEAGYV
ncbi:hypothetical protein Hte_008373 [Hypoxylon texense]